MRRRIAAAAAADAAAVLLFATVGRASHDEALTPAGIAGTAWPFLVGAAAGWLVARGWRRPLAVVPTGVAVWLGTVVVGMLLRGASSQPVAGAFVAVTAVVTGLLLLGWRAVGARWRRRGRSASPEARPAGRR